MSELIASVKNGIINQTATATEKSSTRGTDELGKDAFLQLLVCQMQHQDPLEPSTDTEYISQLATFSQLEQLQNLNASYENTQAFSLVGKNVILKSSDDSQKTQYVSGTVDFINMSGKAVKLSVNGSLYDLSQLYSVIDDQYLLEHGLPSLKQEYSFTYDADAPTPLNFEVNLGEGDTKASEIAILMDGSVLESSLYKLSGTTVTIYAEAFAGLQDGVYKPAVVFNDPYYTTITDEISVRVINSKATQSPEIESTEGTEPTDGSESAEQENAAESQQS